MGKCEGWLKARADQAFPPTRGWSYWDGSNWLQGPNFETQIEWLFNQNNDGPSWRPVPSLECSRELSTPCKEIRIELGGKAREHNGLYLPIDGEYRFGRQVDFTPHHCHHHQCFVCFFYVIDLSKCLQVFQNTSAATGRRYLRYCWVDKNTRSTWSISSSIDGKRNQIHLGARGVCPATGQLHSNPDIKITCSTH